VGKYVISKHLEGIYRRFGRYQICQKIKERVELTWSTWDSGTCRKWSSNTDCHCCCWM